MLSKTVCVVRGIQTFFAVLVIGVVGDMIFTSDWNGNASEVNYAMFLGVWTLVSMAYFIPIALRPTYEKHFFITTAVLDFLSAVFYTGGAIRLADVMGVHSCKDEKYTSTNPVTNSSPDTTKRCREAQAATAFIWFNLLTFALSTILSLRSLFFSQHARDIPDDQKLSMAEGIVGGVTVTDGTPRPMNNISRLFSRRGPKSGNLEAADVRSDNGGSIRGLPREFPEYNPEIRDEYSGRS